ncbi:S8 family peptidase [candidate division KSB1 bacterium]|nr:S8 family peptidase [candidate division KSB1 bacterium]
MRGIQALHILAVVLVATATVVGSEEPQQTKYWVYLIDKGPQTPDGFASLNNEQQISPRALRRRTRVLPEGSLVDRTDARVYSGYVDALTQLGCQIQWPSRWLNAVSAYLSPEQALAVSKLDFVQRIVPVARRSRSFEPEALEPSLLHKSMQFFDYGNSFDQNALSHIPTVHQEGNNGANVLIAVFDTGYRLNHIVFSHLHVVAAYDFINKDDFVDYDPDQDVTSQISHGTKVLSVLAGYAQGSLIGPAYGASFALAKTEHVPTETQAEEDYYIAALEWADSLGADIVTSSLSYLDWYTVEDMDGDTAPITRAVDLAVKKGMVVVTAAGNEGMSNWKTISAPADADSVIAVGAVDRTGSIACFSSYGPTADGRIKPEVVAMGVGNICVQVPGEGILGSAFSSGSGTSFAAPMAAGVAALVLSAVPDLTPMQVRESLMQTATRSTDPDNRYGYGIVQADAAIAYARSLQSGIQPLNESVPSDWRISSYPNPFVAGRQISRIVMNLEATNALRVDIYNLLGQKVVGLWNGPASEFHRLYWDGRDSSGRLVHSGVYFCRVQFGDNVHLHKITTVR